ncbi:MAG: hypothetical protein AB7V26_11540 [Lysobacterales bacterium]
MNRPESRPQKNPPGDGPFCKAELHANGNPTDVLLQALELATGRAPIRTGSGWRSLCPCCAGRSAKVSVAESSTGAALLHAFCGCSASAVLSSVGLELADLYPARLADHSPQGRKFAMELRQIAGWRSALETLAHEAGVLVILAGDVLRGNPEPNHIQRAELALARINDCRKVLR